MTAPSRQRLPNRRPSDTLPVEAGGVAAWATVGFDPATGLPREIFLDPRAGARIGSPVAALISDAAAVVSVALQFGVPADALAHSLARVGSVENPGGVTAEPASILGAAIDLVVGEVRAGRAAPETLTLAAAIRVAAGRLRSYDPAADREDLRDRLSWLAARARDMGFDDAAAALDAEADWLRIERGRRRVTPDGAHAMAARVDGAIDLLDAALAKARGVALLAPVAPAPEAPGGSEL